MRVFNLIVTGYGGQGVLTLANIIANAAKKQALDVKESELHGLAQRGGSLNCYVRFGKVVRSPLVMKGKADLIIALEATEALRACCYWANNKTVVVMNSKVFRSSFTLKDILEKIKKITKKVYVLDADKEVKKLTKDIRSVNIFMLGYVIKNKFLPLKKKTVWKAIEEKINVKFLNENKKVFEKPFEKWQK